MGKDAMRSWRAKLQDARGLPKVGPIEGRMSRRWGEGTMVIPAPVEVDDVMRRVPAGSVTTINEIRGILAHRHGVNICCPMTTGIFAWIAAHASAEAASEGEPEPTPYWRTLKSDGSLNPKYPGGVEEQARRLSAEGLDVEPASGKRPPKVRDWESHLARL